MTEKQEAFDIAHRLLENPSLDPDGDASVLARQFLRAREEIDAMRDALEDAQVEMRFVRTFVCSPQRIQEPTGLSLYDETLAKIGAVLDNFTVPHAMATTNDKPEPREKWPDPTPEMLDSPVFEAIWRTIQRWDIAVPSVYGGYCSATGNHVRAIMDALPLPESPPDPRDDADAKGRKA